MNEELPHGWARFPVEEVFRSFGGGTPNKGTPAYWKGSIPWLSSGDIKTERIHSATEFITRAGLENSSANLCRPGSVLVVVRSGVLKHTLPVAILEREAAINQDIKCFDSGCSELNEWLSLALRASANDILALNREGTTVQSVKYETLKEFDLSIPPRAEQKRIVAKLEKLLGQVDTCQQRLSRIPTLLKRFRQAVLTAACSGRLTADWRDTHKEVRPARDIIQSLKTPDPETHLDIFEMTSDNEIPETWSWVRLGKLGPLVGGGTPSTGNSTFWSGDIPWVSPKDMKRNRINHSEDHITELGLKSSSVSKIDPGAILFVVRGMILNHTLPTAITDVAVTLNQDMKALIPEMRRMSEYLSLAARHIAPSILFEVKEATHGTRRIESSVLKNWAIPLPPLEEQPEIVRRVENLFALADRLEARFMEGRKRVDSITQAILAKAFRGELVPTEAELAKAEGRSFESAADLLERIQKNGDRSKAKK